MKVPRGRTLLVTFVSLVAACCAALLAGPTALGGPTSVLAVSGNSMEPRINSGDLILVRTGGPYHVGQIVAYHNLPAAANFLHRIIGTRGTGFVMKGDHNGWVDPGTAQPSQVIGSLWIRIPHGGSVFRWIANPLHGAVWAALAALAIGLWETFRRRRRRRRRAESGRDDAGSPIWAPFEGDLPENVSTGPWAPRPPPKRPVLPLDTMLKATLAAALLVAAVCVFLGIVSFSRPASASGRPVPLYRQSGTLTYQATALPSPVYPTGRVTSPTPVYLHLVNGVVFTFADQIVPAGHAAISGTAQLNVVVHGNTGWTRVVAVTPPQPFQGTTIEVRRWVSIAQIRQLLTSIESLTSSPDSYSLTVAPVVVTHGSLAGHPFVRRFAPSFAFGLTDTEMTLPGGPTTPQAQAAALQSGSLVTRPPGSPQAAELAIGPVRMPVRWWRTLALVLGATMLMIAAAAAFALQRRLVRKGEPAVIAAKHRDLLVPLTGAPAEGQRHVTVRSFDDLVRVARMHETTILHHAAADRSENYLVLADGVTFRYRSSGSVDRSDAPPKIRTAG